MFTRIVKMEFQENKVAQFLTNFETAKHKIRTFKGCMHLELWRDKTSQLFFLPTVNGKKKVI